MAVGSNFLGQSRASFRRWPPYWSRRLRSWRRRGQINRGGMSSGAKMCKAGNRNQDCVETNEPSAFKRYKSNYIYIHTYICWKMVCLSWKCCKQWKPKWRLTGFDRIWLDCIGTGETPAVLPWGSHVAFRGGKSKPARRKSWRDFGALPKKSRLEIGDGMLRASMDSTSFMLSFLSLLYFVIVTTTTISV